MYCCRPREGIFLCFRVYDGGHHPAALPPAELNTASDRRWKVPRGGGSVDWSPPLPSFVPSPSRPDPLIPVRLRPASSLFSPRIAAAVSTRRSYALLRIWGFGASSPPVAPISGIGLTLDFDLPFRVFDRGSDLVVCSPIHAVSGGALRGF
ncbi:hypothetical protein C4D60_Mb06t15450 [Musa balbisiana]|uniref:Uncharacterized protein n=1 Tax=Musa balbisiana TaxID=52838 RepID=A0A4S8IN73_MUSBA|nr:hypothetical protein C4D60_Mb06t15450 [Musa balbisiana]